jgi:hypothetical protein
MTTPKKSKTKTKARFQTFQAYNGKFSLDTSKVIGFFASKSIEKKEGQPDLTHLSTIILFDMTRVEVLIPYETFKKEINQ